MRWNTLVLISLAGICPALAFDIPKLPPTARALKGPEIAALYSGAYMVGMNFEQREMLTFVAKIAPDARSFVVHVFADNRPVGSGQFTARVNNDLWCYTPAGTTQEKCVTVHLDGNIIYEMTREGRMSARNIAAK
jgi:hypothetical protein